MRQIRKPCLHPTGVYQNLGLLKNTRQGLITPASNMNHHLFNKIGFLEGSRLDNGLQSNCLYSSDSNPTMKRSDRKLFPNYASSVDYSNCSNALTLSLLGITSIQKSLPQLEWIQRILLKHRIFKKLNVPFLIKNSQPKSDLGTFSFPLLSCQSMCLVWVIHTEGYF